VSVVTIALVPAGLGFGLCAGSFVATAAVRAARDEPFLTGRSHCDGCMHELGFLATIPVVSYVGRRGSCPECGARISPLHPLGELLGAALVVGILLVTPSISAMFEIPLGFCLMASAFIDAQTFRLPDKLTIAVACICIVLGALRSWHVLGVGLIWACASFLALEALRRMYRSWRGTEGLGFGDIKLLSAMAIWLGPAVPYALALAALVGLAVAVLLRRQRIPFGPALAAAGFLVGCLGITPPWPLMA